MRYALQLKQLSAYNTYVANSSSHTASSSTCCRLQYATPMVAQYVFIVGHQHHTTGWPGARFSSRSVLSLAHVHTWNNHFACRENKNTVHRSKHQHDAAPPLYNKSCVRMQHCRELVGHIRVHVATCHPLPCQLNNKTCNSHTATQNMLNPPAGGHKALLVPHAPKCRDAQCRWRGLPSSCHR